MFSKLTKSALLVLSTTFAHPAIGQDTAVTDEPNYILNFYDQNNNPHSIEVFAVDHDELRNFIRNRSGLTPTTFINYADHEDLVREFIGQKVDKIGGMEFFKANFVDSLTSKLLNRADPIGQPLAFDRSKIQIPSRALIVDADPSFTAQEWVAGWLKIDPSNVQDDPGIDDAILEDFIRFHELAHTMNADEPQADRFATHFILRKYGITQESLATLQFIHDVRMTMPTHPKYMHNHSEISYALRFKLHSVADEIEADSAPVTHNTRLNPYDTIDQEAYASDIRKGVYTTIFLDGTTDLSQAPETANFIENLPTFRARAEAAFATVESSYVFSPENSDRTMQPDGDMFFEHCVGDCPEAKAYLDFMSALDRLETVLSSSDSPSAYVSLSINDLKFYPGPAYFDQGDGSSLNWGATDLAR